LCGFAGKLVGEVAAASSPLADFQPFFAERA